ncbi:BA14K-like protein [Faunimonas pinastri]|uniref:Lectin-like protein BA14k n=1 Tax=Faunimonas pinastri TaxID=1855383 RepID=A0A1H9KS75_9HYPH|nr:BA14K family protein [Faunimonas pinastri]SER01735.1 BA14K-like protein [Faunimonas pinastri]
MLRNKILAGVAGALALVLAGSAQAQTPWFHGGGHGGGPGGGFHGGPRGDFGGGRGWHGGGHGYHGGGYYDGFYGPAFFGWDNPWAYDGYYAYRRPVVIVPPAQAAVPEAAYGPRKSGAWYSYCSHRYKTFDARSGTFIGSDHRRHICR